MKLLTAKDALQLIAKGESLADYEVSVTEPLDAVDAFNLRKNGIEVPDELITYEDEDLTYDEAFDEPEWQRLSEKVEEPSFEIAYQLSLTEDEQEWLANKKIDVQALLSELLKNYIRTDRLIQREQ